MAILLENMSLEKEIIKEVLTHLPYRKPFLFVEDITSISEEGVTGYYTLKKDEYFYEGHFPDAPITPGVILTEIAGQIGVVCLGLFLEIKKSFPHFNRKLLSNYTASKMDFFKPVFPKEKVKVVSKKIYFRFNKLKCEVFLYDSKGELACKGTLEGFIREDK